MGLPPDCEPRWRDSASVTPRAWHSAARTSRTERAPSIRSDALAYPADLEERLEVRGGGTLELRPIRSDDDEKLVEFHHRLSTESIYCRYFSYHPELSPGELYRLTHVDYDNRLALVIEDADELVGVARYERGADPSEAEVAFVVRDDYQHLGLGHRLLACLATAAWTRGVSTFTAETLSRNHDMIAVFRHSGFPISMSVSAGEVSVRLSIDPHNDSGALRSPETRFLAHPWS